MDQGNSDLRQPLTIPVTIDGKSAVAVIDTGARKTRINWKLGRALGLDPATIEKGDVIQVRQTTQSIPGQLR
jgi:hypothetical protein